MCIEQKMEGQKERRERERGKEEVKEMRRKDGQKYGIRKVFENLKE